MEELLCDNPIKADVVARMLGCSEYTVRQKVREGKLPHYRVGKRIYFRAISIQKWIKEQETESVTTFREDLNGGE